MKIDGVVFSDFVQSRHPGRWYSHSRCGSFFLKVQNLDEPIRQAWDLKQADFIMRALNQFHCQSVPKVHSSGYLQTNVARILFNTASTNLFYQISEYIQPLKRSARGDLALALLELARRGVFPNDVKMNNLGWNNSRLYILDFDQSIISDNAFEAADALSFLEEVNNLQLESLFFPIFSLFKTPWDKIMLQRLFTNSGQLIISKTSRFRRQLSTRNRFNNYYRIDTPFIFADGSRDILARAEILDSYKFDFENSVLDFGANLGLIGLQIEKRVSLVDAYELDSYTSSLGQTLMNINQSKVCFLNDFPSKRYSHLILFSVLQHISNLKSVAAELDKLAGIILVENRMKESGKVIRSRKTWEVAESWNFDSVEELEVFLLSLFPTKKKIRTIGESDKGRFVFELS